VRALITQNLVSVIIPTKNSEATVERCLHSVREQSYPAVEIVIIDAHSADATRRIAGTYGAKVIGSDAKRSEARNLGAKKSRGAFLFFVDADNELTPNVVSDCVSEAREGANAVIVPEFSVGQGFWARCKSLEKRCYVNDKNIEAPRFFRKKDFIEVGGFDVTLEAGEDWDLSLRFRRIGAKIGRSAAPIKHYEGSLSLFQTMRKKYVYGKSIIRYQRKNPREALVQLQLMRPSFFQSSCVSNEGSIIFTGMILMKACEFAAGGFGMLNCFIRTLLGMNGDEGDY
jgi:glycosyltransferase involved in cell wall biosynthesis